MAKKISDPLRITKTQELLYQKQLMILARLMAKSVKEELLPFLKSNQEGYVIDSFASQLALIFNKLNMIFTGTATISFANNTATKMVQNIDKTSKDKFGKSIKKVTGVDPSSFLETPEMQDFLQVKINDNVDLIKDLPNEYLKQIKIIVNNGVASGARYSTIAKQILAKTGSANSKLVNRVKTIARNEVQTINAQINVRRSEALGITEGVFMTSQDERVRPCHAELNGVKYDLKKGAWSKKCQKYIQPGITDINCRCSFRPVIEVD